MSPASQIRGKPRFVCDAGPGVVPEEVLLKPVPEQTKEKKKKNRLKTQSTYNIHDWLMVSLTKTKRILTG